MTNQKSTPLLRNNNSANKPIKNLKNEKKRSNTPPNPDYLKDNIVIFSIDDTGKIPPKPYVLNVRKTDVIQQTRRMRKMYNCDPNDENRVIEPSNNHDIKIIKDVTKDLPTVEDLPKGAKIIHRYNYSYNPELENIGRFVIDDTGKIPKKEVVVSPRRVLVIPTERKPRDGNALSPISPKQGGLRNPSGKKPDKNNTNANNLRSRIPNNQAGNKKTNANVRDTRGGAKNATKTNTTTTTKTETRTTRGKNDGNSNKTKVQESTKTTTTRTKVTETRTTSRGKNDGGSKTTRTTTKTTETTSGKGGNQLRGNKNKSDSGKDKRGKSHEGDLRGKSKETKITITKTTESSNAGGAGGNKGKGSNRFKANKESDSGNSKFESKSSKTKTEGGKTTTTTTEIKIEKSSNVDNSGNESKVKKFRSFRTGKK